MPANEKTQKRTIAHALFTYRTAIGGEGVAMRGDTVDLLPADIERGEKWDAFTPEVGDKPAPAGKLPDYPANGSPAEQDNWITSGTVEEIMAAVNADPAIVDSVIAAETRRKDAARKTLLEALSVLVGRSS